MSNQYPPPDPGQEPYGQSGQPPPPPPPGPQWNPQSAGTPPPGSGGEPGYGQPGYGQPGQGQPSHGQYGQPPYSQPPGPGAPGGYGMPQQTSPLAIVSLVLGILGVCCGHLFVLSIGALVTGFIGRSQINQSVGRLKGGGLAIAGLILGVLGILIGIVYWTVGGTDFLESDFYVDTN